MLAARQPAAAVAQPEQRVELLDQLVREPPAAQRSDRDRVAGRRLGRHLEDRERDVEPAADVARAARRCRARRMLPGRAMLLDQPVLEHERAELGGSCR